MRPLVLSLALALTTASVASAQSPPPVALPADSWAAQLDALGHWAAAHQAPPACTANCFVIDRIHLTGTPPALSFEITGHVLATGGSAVDVPLFGPPADLSLRDVREGTRPAIVGFDESSYFVHTAARDFTLTGTLALRESLTLTITGPVNTLDADLARTSLAEGNHLSGLTHATVHFTAIGGTAAAQANQPAVFERARAFRIGRETRLEEHVTLRSGSDLGVVRLPLLPGTHVLDVTGAAGWRTEESELVVPTTGHEASLVVTATLDALVPFVPDPRSSYEWWMFESDPEHQLAVQTDARAVDPSQSPIARTQPTARLYLVQRGAHVTPSVHTLASADVLAAVVRSLTRTVVVTRTGDLVAQDSVTYDDNGIDYLDYDPHVSPVYLATDGTAERILRDATGHHVMVPLRNGAHTVTVQGVGHQSLGALGGRIEFAMPTHPLVTSATTIDVGLPPSVHPIAFVGGTVPFFFLDTPDLFALLVAFITAWLAFRDRTSRACTALGLAGLWFVAPELFVAVVGLLALGAAVWLAARLLPRAWRSWVVVAMLGGGVLFVMMSSAAMFALRSPSRSYRTRDMAAASGEMAEGGRGGPTAMARPAEAPVQAVGNAAENAGRFDQAGQAQSVFAAAAMLPGAIPVALTLPTAARDVTAGRELVTTTRPFVPVLYYVTDLCLAPFALAWLGALSLLVWHHRLTLARWRAALRDRLAASRPT